MLEEAKIGSGDDYDCSVDSDSEESDTQKIDQDILPS